MMMIDHDWFVTTYASDWRAIGFPQVLRAIPIGRKNAVLIEVIARKAGLKHERTEQPTRQAIAHLVRENHIPVCSHKNGFWLPTCREDVKLTCLNYDARARGIRARIDVLERSAEMLPGSWETQPELLSE